MKISISFFKKQLQFINDEAPIVGFIGGLGSGKTFTGSHWLLKKALTLSGKRFYACANTFQQLKDAVYPKFFSILESYGLVENTHWWFNKSTKDLWLFNESLIMFRSLKNYNALRGPEISGALIDEARDTPEEAVNVILGRLREIPNAQLKITTTPAGYNWIYEWIQSGKIKYYRMLTTENKFLPESYIKNLKKQYSGDFLRQEMFAEFINFGGRLVYNSFDRSKNLIKKIEKKTNTIHIGLDFNIDPFCAIACYYVDGIIYPFQEIVLRNLDIKAMIKEIVRLFPGKDIIIYPDASGNNRNVVNNETVIKILKRNFGEENVRFFRKNPRIYERIQIVNNWLDAEKIKVLNKCQKLITDFEKVKFVRSGAFELDKTDSELTHISDALGYMVYYLEKQKNNVWKIE